MNFKLCFCVVSYHTTTRSLHSGLSNNFEFLYCDVHKKNNFQLFQDLNFSILRTVTKIHAVTKNRTSFHDEHCITKELLAQSRQTHEKYGYNYFRLLPAELDRMSLTVVSKLEAAHLTLSYTGFLTASTSLLYLRCFIFHLVLD